MVISYDRLYHILTKKMSDAEIELSDMIGDSNHYKVRITSKQFNGISKLEQHRVVYKILERYLQTAELHAISIDTQPIKNLDDDATRS